MTESRQAWLTGLAEVTLVVNNYRYIAVNPLGMFISQKNYRYNETLSIYLYLQHIGIIYCLKCDSICETIPPSPLQNTRATRQERCHVLCYCILVSLDSFQPVIKVAYHNFIIRSGHLESLLQLNITNCCLTKDTMGSMTVHSNLETYNALSHSSIMAIHGSTNDWSCVKLSNYFYCLFMYFVYLFIYFLYARYHAWNEINSSPTTSPKYLSCFCLDKD